MKEKNSNHISNISSAWFFLDTGINDGIFNMSCDNFLLDSISNHSIQLPLLRVYGWTKPTLSLGANQLFDELIHCQQNFSSIIAGGAEREASRARNSVTKLWRVPEGDRTRSDGDDTRLIEKYPTVKRITGGQAVLHGISNDELTYSIFVNYGYKVKQLYFEVGEVLLAFLNIYNLKGEFGHSSNNYFKNFDCFSSKTEADIVVNDIKVIGSAQYRKKEYVLQHGSIKLDTMHKLSGKNTNFEDAKINLKKAFQDKLKVEFRDYTLKSSLNIFRGSNT